MAIRYSNGNFKEYVNKLILEAENSEDTYECSVYEEKENGQNKKIRVTLEKEE